MHLVIFEGSRWIDFLPLTLTRPTFCIRSGATTLLEKQVRAVRPDRLSLWVRPQMIAYVKQHVLPTLTVPTTINQPLDDEPALVFAARTLHLSSFEHPADFCAVAEEDRMIRFAYLKQPGLTQDDILQRSPRWMEVADLPQAMQQTRFPRNWADFVSWNEELLMCDSIYWSAPPPGDKCCETINDFDIHAEPDVRIGAHVVLDATNGPILLARGARIGAGSVIEGPCHIGEHARIAPQALIRPGTSIGPHCRIGGEVGNCIFHSYSNKSHFGFIGDSIVGSWVNIGAGATTSNLKSTYGLIKLHIGAKQVQSDRVLLGCAIGDHAKLATGSLLQAGAYIGAASMVALSARVPPFVPSFNFWTDDVRDPMPTDKAIEVAARVLPRRGKAMDDVETDVLKYAAGVAGEVEG